MSEVVNYFTKLNAIDVNDHKEVKDTGRVKLAYLSWAWAWAWGELKRLFPDSTYTVYENAEGWNYHTDGRTCWVKTGVTVNGIEHIEYLPVMDNRNQSIPTAKVTSFEVNKAIQRSLTKAVARHGLGLYIYAGEDLPEPEDGIKRIGADGANAIFAKFVNQGYEKAQVNDAMKNAMAAYGVSSPTEVPVDVQKDYAFMVGELLTNSSVV